MNAKPELIPQGPLDLVRAINHEAAELDFLLSIHPVEEVEMEDIQSALSKIKKFDEHNPLMGSEVEVYGDVLTPAMGFEDNMTTALVSAWQPNDVFENSELTPVSGEYRGYYIVRVYDPVIERVVHRVTHMVADKGSTVTDIDKFGRLVTIMNCSHVCASRSEMVPVLPVMAHSLEDLQDDHIIKHFDSILGSPEFSENEKIRMLGKFARHVLTKEEMYIGRNKQRISYLNGSGLLGSKALTSRDVLLGTKEDIEGEFDQRRIVLSDVSKSVRFSPRLLESSFSYVRTSRDRGFIDGTNIDLYAVGVTDSGQGVMAPLKNIELT